MFSEKATVSLIYVNVYFWNAGFESTGGKEIEKPSALSKWAKCSQQYTCTLPLTLARDISFMPIQKMQRYVETEGKEG